MKEESEDMKEESEDGKAESEHVSLPAAPTPTSTEAV